MARVLLKMQLPSDQVDLDAVRRVLKIGKNQIDLDFGVVSIRSRDHLYAVLVDSDVAARVRGTSQFQASANPGVVTAEM